MSMLTTVLLVGLILIIIIGLKDIIASAIVIGIAVGVICVVYMFVPEARDVLAPVYNFVVEAFWYMYNVMLSFWNSIA